MQEMCASILFKSTGIKYGDFLIAFKIRGFKNVKVAYDFMKVKVKN